MNPFYDISEDENLAVDQLQLKNLGSQQIFAIIGGRRGSDFWGTSGTASKTTYTDTTPEHYDRQFVYKLQKWQPIYDIDRLIEHHYQHYASLNPGKGEQFLKHMRYVILPNLKKHKNADVVLDLFEQWLDNKEQKSESTPNIPYTVNNNTINVGNVNAPTQFQQNSDHSTQTQHNHLQKDDIKQVFELLQKDIQQVNQRIRKDFEMEMDYAISQLDREKDVKPQLLNIGSLIKEAGMGTFTNLLAAPIFELIKPYLGLH